MNGQNGTSESDLISVAQDGLLLDLLRPNECAILTLEILDQHLGRRYPDTRVLTRDPVGAHADRRIQIRAHDVVTRYQGYLTTIPRHIFVASPAPVKPAQYLNWRGRFFNRHRLVEGVPDAVDRSDKLPLAAVIPKHRTNLVHDRGEVAILDDNVAPDPFKQFPSANRIRMSSQKYDEGAERLGAELQLLAPRKKLATSFMKRVPLEPVEFRHRIHLRSNNGDYSQPSPRTRPPDLG